MITQFGCDGRRSNADKIELGLRFARLSFGAGHHAALAKMGERDANWLRGHSADRWTAISGKLAHPTRFERVTFAFGGQSSMPAAPAIGRLQQDRPERCPAAS